jgi:hypothetical protein
VVTTISGKFADAIAIKFFGRQTKPADTEEASRENDMENRRSREGVSFSNHLCVYASQAAHTAMRELAGRITIK